MNIWGYELVCQCDKKPWLSYSNGWRLGTTAIARKERWFYMASWLPSLILQPSEVLHSKRKRGDRQGCLSIPGSMGVTVFLNRAIKAHVQIIHSQPEEISRLLAAVRETQWPNPERPNLCWAPAFYVPGNCHFCVEGECEGPREMECPKQTRLMIR